MISMGRSEAECMVKAPEIRRSQVEVLLWPRLKLFLGRP